jgi:hypothetical protein
MLSENEKSMYPQKISDSLRFISCWLMILKFKNYSNVRAGGTILTRVFESITIRDWGFANLDRYSKKVLFQYLDLHNN